MENDRFQNPVGIGGWLLIPLGMFIMTIGRGLLGLRGLVFHEFEVFDVIAVLFAIWSLLCVYLILKRSPRVRYACATYFIVCAILCLIGCVTDESGFQPDSLSVVRIVWFSVWAVYFLKSKRVANTFSRSGTDILTKRNLDPEMEVVLSRLLIRRFAARVTDIAVFLLAMLCTITISTNSGLFMTVGSVGGIACFVGYFFFYGLVVDLVVVDLIGYPLLRQTFGKWLFGLRIVTEEGKTLTRWQCMFRSGNCLYHLAWPVLLVVPSLHSVHHSLLYLGFSFMVICYQYYKVLMTGRTSYDAVYGTSVVGETLSCRRLVLGMTVVIVLFTSLIVVLFR